jgi:hypothetical protein
VAPAFDAAQGFGYDKPASEPCRHLQPDHRCGIHPVLVTQGFPGCASFDCFGAGQAVTARFQPADWHGSQDLALQMFNAYSRLRALHELRAMTWVAGTRADATAAATLRQIEDELARLCDNEEPLDGVALRRRVQQQIRTALAGVQ